MRYCKDCRSLVREHQTYCPKCSGDLYARKRTAEGLFRSLYEFDLRVGR